METKHCMFDFEKEDFFVIKDNYKKIKDISSKLLFGNRVNECKLSIMIPTYLRNNFLLETIDSALAQTVRTKYEIVVVDNNDDPNDLGTLNVIKKYGADKVCYYKNEKNLGMFGNWNRCIELARGDWVLILHDDDLIENDYLEEMIKVLNRYPESFCIGCDHKEIDLDGMVKTTKKTALNRILDIMGKGKTFQLKIKDMYYIHPIDIMGCFLNRKAAIEIGGFDERWYPISDYVFLLNMVYRGKVWQIEKKLFLYRVAVNVSFRVDHVIGCLEADISMRKCINKKFAFRDREKDLRLRSILENNQERDSFMRFGSKLSDNEKEKVQEEFILYKTYCGLYDVNQFMHSVFHWFQRWYIFKMRCIRAKRIRT